MMKYLILISFVLIGSGAFAQGTEGVVFVSNDFESGIGVQVKWISNRVLVPEGYDVYRQEDGGSWQKLNSDRINVTRTIPSVANVTKTQRDFHDFVINSSYEEFQSNPVRAFVLIEAIYNPVFSGILGIAFHDKTAVTGKKYRYKVEGFLGTQKIQVGQSDEITCGAYQPIAAPEDIVFNRTKSSVEINWKPDLYRYYGVNIYRKDGDGEFVKITKPPRAIQKGKNKNGSETFPEVFYTDNNIELEESYVYKLEAIDYFGQPSAMSAEFSIPAIDFIPPAAPFNFKPESHAALLTVDLRWDAIEESDLAGFNVYRSSQLEGPYEKVNAYTVEKSKRLYVDKVPAAGHYYYYGSSIDEAGNESTTGKIYVQVRDMIPPAAPQGLKSTAEEGKITLSWKPNSEPDLLGYYVQRSLNDDDNSDNHYVNVNQDVIQGTSWTNDLARNIKNKFVYRIIAIDTSFNRSKPSINSLAQMPDVVPPKSPLIKYVRAEQDKIIVGWLPNTESDLEGYNVYRRIARDSGAFNQLNIRPVPGNINTYTDRNAEPGERYEYVLKATDMSGNTSDESNVYAGEIKRKQTLPEIGEIEAKANSRKKRITLAWSLSETDAEIRGYTIYRQDPNGILKPQSGLLTEMEFIDTTEPGAYTYQVRCYLKSGHVIKSENIKIELIKDE